ncbi:MAG: integrase [Clostridia bacterium BRH_c25]|nr:MAG: integrase [Clostridia bacterium BRH_c25]
MKRDADFPYYLSGFLARFLPGELGARENTVLSYRDTFTLFLKYCKSHKNILPENMTLDKLTKELVESFLVWIEEERSCGIATRNQRLAAIHSFCRFMQTEDVIRINQYQRILSIPKKKFKAGTVNYMSLEGIRLILSQPDTGKLSGRRDLALLSLMYDTGARVQEMSDLTVGDVRIDAPATVRISGKGGKTRIVPLMGPTANLVKQYISDAGLSGSGRRSYPLFANRGGGKISRAGIKYILDKYVEAAKNENAAALPDVISPHSLRHSKAMHLLHAGVNLVYIRDILGHADLKTTEIYARIDGEMKRKALEEAYTSVTPSDEVPLWQQDSDMLNWLKSLGK